VNQQWELWGGDWGLYDQGYLNFWTIKVYYEDPSDYCSALGGCGYEYISGVQVGSINNTGTGCSPHSDYTSMSTTMEIGTSYPITVTNGSGYSVDECGIWVDWNQDTDFAASERVTPVSGSPGAGPYTATITPPGTALTGECRLRVRINDSSYDSMSPCGGATYGEVEDYTINVAGTTFLPTISGRVMTSGGAALEGVLITGDTDNSSNDVSTLTDASGYYELEVPTNPWSGMVYPSKAGYSFGTTVFFAVDLTEDLPDVDFTGTYIVDTAPVISGYVRDANNYGIRDVLISASTGESIVTDHQGFYELAVSTPLPYSKIGAWTGTITPSKDFWVFEPVDISYADLAVDISDQNYVGTYTADPTPTILGYVKTSGGEGIEAVQVYGDNYGGSAITDASGYYELTVPDLKRPAPEPWSGTVTPVKTDWSFGPVNRVYSDLNSDIGSQNYTGSYVGIGCAAGWVEEWVAWYHGDEVQWYNDLVFDMAVDDSGNVHITGGSVDRTDSGISYDYATVKYDSEGTELWVARYNGPEGSADEARAIAVDALGNVYVTGESRGVTSKDYATIKYGPDSNVPLWVARYDGPDNLADEVEAIAVDDSGNVYITGHSYSSSHGRDIVTIKYDSSDGNEVWAERYNGPGDDWDYASAVAVDDSGNVYVTGTSAGAGTSDDTVTIKYEPDGNEAWAARYNGPANGFEMAEGLAIDGSGNIYVTGGSEGVGTSGDVTTIKYDTNGNEVWVARYDGPAGQEDFGGKIVIDGSGNIYVSATANYTFPTATADYVTIKYGAESNEPEWVALYDGLDNLGDMPADIALDDSGNIYVTGYANYYNSGVSDPNPPSGNFATIKYGPDSNVPIWIAEYDGPPNRPDIGQAIALDSSGNVYVTGFNNAYVTVKYSQCPVMADLELDNSWMYQCLPGQSNSELTAGVSITDDPMGNSTYSYAWEIVLPEDVSLTPTTAGGGGAGDASWTLTARGCDEPAGLSDSGQTFKVRVRITGDDYGNTGVAETEFGIALLGDVSNDGVVNVADRSITNAFWRTGSAGAYTLRDCDVNCDGVVNVADRSIANAIWRGLLGQNSVSNPCPLR
jgi:hypothetical protein